MSAQRTEIVVGAGVLAVAIGFLAYAGQSTGFTSSVSGYSLGASFRSIEGITVGSDVRLAGVKVGSITDIALNPATFRADAKLSVQEGLLLPDDSAIIISSEGLLGGNYVEIQPGGSPFNLEPDDEIINTQGSVSLISLLLKFVTASGGDAK